MAGRHRPGASRSTGTPISVKSRRECNNWKTTPTIMNARRRNGAAATVICSTSLNGWAVTNANPSAKTILLGLVFQRSINWINPSKKFSGGWRMRAELARLLLQNPDVLLLDEPTNHLDLRSVIWLESFLKSYDGSILLISHDRSFLNATGRAGSSNSTAANWEFIRATTTLMSD